MNRRFLIRAGLLVLVGLMAAVLIRLWPRITQGGMGPSTEADLAKLGKRLGVKPPPPPVAAQSIPKGRSIRVAMGGLGLRGSLDGEVADLAVAKLSSAEGVELVERQALEAALREFHMTLGGFVRARDALKVGKLVHADWFVFGSTFQLNGTNSLVLRMVDAKTGILRNAAALKAGQSSTALASDVAEFVKRTRMEAAQAKPPVYLGLGGFEDVSVNNRLADFPSQLRAYLVSAYHDSGVTLVEREFVDALLHEITLDEAGLAEPGSNEPPARLQPAFWLVEGTYQSYETDRKQVELKMSVDHVFGRSLEGSFRKPPGAELFGAAKDFIDQTMRQEADHFGLGRLNEAHWELDMGRRIAGIGPRSIGANQDYYASADQSARRSRNINEAIQSFQIAVMLEPTNREAKFDLGSCLMLNSVGRTDEALDYFRQLIEDEKTDKWTSYSQMKLVEIWHWANQAEAAKWFANAESLTTNAKAAAYYHRQAQEAVPGLKDSAEADAARKDLFDGLRGKLTSKVRVTGAEIDAYIRAYGKEHKADAVAHLNLLLPELETNFPTLFPSLLAETVSYQADSNSPVVTRFENWITNQAEVTDQTPFEFEYLAALDQVRMWGVSQTNYALVRVVLEQQRRARVRSHEFNDDKKLNLAFALGNTGEWKQALDLFESFSNRPVMTEGHGFYGKDVTLVFPHTFCRRCREKLGLPEEHDPRVFSLAAGDIPIQEASFTTDEGGLWLGEGDRLLRIGFNLATNAVFHLPIPPGTPINCVAASPQAVWVGTEEEGLLEFNRTNKEVRRWTDRDGLLMSSVCGLEVAGGTLWIGYGHKNWAGFSHSPDGGGLGRMNLVSGQFESFGKSILASGKAPDSPVGSLAARTEDDVWLVPGYPNVLEHFDGKSKKWLRIDGKIGNIASVATTSETVFIAPSPGYVEVKGYPGVTNYPPIIRALNLADNQWRAGPTDGFARQGAQFVTVAGNQVWVGGLGYVALLDPQSLEILKYAYVNSSKVDSLRVGGGFLWGRGNGWIFHAPLPP